MELGRAESAIVFLYLELRKETFNETPRPPPTWVNTMFQTADHTDFSCIAKGWSQRLLLLPDFGGN